MAKKDVSVEQSLVMVGEPKTVAIDSIRRHPDNYRKGDLTTIIESIKANKFYSRIVVQKSTGLILAGNHRHQALEAMGVKDVPIEEVDVDDEAARRILLVDNLSSDKAENDDAKLVELLKLEIQKNEELTGTGMTPDELSDLIERSEEKPNKGSSPPRPPKDGGNYKEQYAVTVICHDEEHQQRVYETLTEDGFTCRVVNT